MCYTDEGRLCLSEILFMTSCFLLFFAPYFQLPDRENYLRKDTKKIQRHPAEQDTKFRGCQWSLVLRYQLFLSIAHIYSTYYKTELCLLILDENFPSMI